MATQSSDRSCRVYQITQDGGIASSGAGRPAVKCCNVIKSCVIASDDGSSGSSTTVGNVQECTSVADEKSCAVDSDASGAARNPSETEGVANHTKLTNNDGKVFAGGVPNIGAGGALAAGNTQGKGVVEERCRTNEDASAIDGGSTKDKTKPVQRKSLFVDETVTSFFRRLSWSPDGAFLITPTAQHWDAATRKTQFCTYLFVRGQFVK